MTISPLVCEAFSLHTPLALISPFQKLYIHGSVLISTVCERMTVTRNSDFEFSDAPLDLDRNAPHNLLVKANLSTQDAMNSISSCGNRTPTRPFLFLMSVIVYLVCIDTTFTKEAPIQKARSFFWLWSLLIFHESRVFCPEDEVKLRRSAFSSFGHIPRYLQQEQVAPLSLTRG